MLVLTRKRDEKVCIGQQITVTILRVKGRSVQIGIEAPDSVRVLRGELVDSGGGRAKGALKASARSAAAGDGDTQARGEEPRRSEPSDGEASRGEDAVSPADPPSGPTGMVDAVLWRARRSSRPMAASRLIAPKPPTESAGAVISRGHDLGAAAAGGAVLTVPRVRAATGFEILTGRDRGPGRESAAS